MPTEPTDRQRIDMAQHTATRRIDHLRATLTRDAQHLADETARYAKNLAAGGPDTGAANRIAQGAIQLLALAERANGAGEIEAFLDDIAETARAIDERPAPPA